MVPKRPLDSCVESSKTCPKKSESEVCRSSDLRSPLGRNECGRGKPPSILIRRTGPASLEQSRVCAREVLRRVRRRQSLGLPNHGTWCGYSRVVGGIDIESSEPFDKLKVAVKRGDIDWLHIVPEISWMGQERVITRLIKLCRVAHRRGIWWSIENSGHFGVVAFQQGQESL